MINTLPRMDRKSSWSSERRRDPEGVRARALAAAVAEFSARGYEAGSLRSIAQRADVSQPLISYHFGSKANLWTAVKARVVQLARESLARELAGRSSTADRVAGAMQAFFAHAAATPDNRRIGLWAQLRGGEDFGGEATMLRGVTELVRRAQNEGQLRDDIPAEHLVWLFRSAVYEWIGNRERIRRAFGWDDDDGIDDAYLDSLRKLAAPCMA